MSVGAIRAGRAMVEIFADSSMLARGLSSARSQLARFASTIRRLGTTQVVLGVGMAAPIALAVKQYAELEQKINSVRALSGASAAQMRSVQQAIMQIGMSTGRPFGDIAEGMMELVKAGVQIKDLNAATKVIADFSQAAGLDMASGTKIGIQVLTEFGLSMDHLTRVADVLQEMANATVSSVDDLGDGFRYAGQTAKLFGLSLEQTGAAVAFLQQSGLTASTAGTSFNQMLLQMIDKLDALEGAIGGLRDAGGDFLPFEQILEKLQVHLAGMDRVSRLKFLNDMFDVRGMRGAAALLENIEGWMDLVGRAQGSAGASARKAREMQDAFVVAFEKMTNGARAFSYAIGEVLDSDLREVFGVIANVTAGLGPFVKANGDAVKAVARFAAAATASGIAFFTAGVSIQLMAFALEGFAKLAGAVVAPLGGIMSLASALGASFRVLSLRATAALTSIVRTAVGLAAAISFPMRAVAALLVDVVYNLVRATTVVGVAVGVFAQLVGLAASVGIAIAGAFGGAATVVAAAAVAVVALRETFERLVPLLKAFGSGVATVFGGLAARASAVWPEIVASTVAGWKGVADAIQAGDLSLAWRVFAQTAQAVLSQVMVIIGPWVDEITGVAAEVGAALSSAFTSLVGVVSNVFGEIRLLAGPVFEWLSGLGDWILDGLAAAFPGIADMFSQLATSADATGARILEALSAGDIIKSWIIASSAISQMMVRIGSAWRTNVVDPVRQAAVMASEVPATNRMIEGSRFQNTGPAIRDITGATTPDQLAAARAAAEPLRQNLEAMLRAGGNAGATGEQIRDAADAAADLQALDAAVEMVTGRFKQLGIVTDAERQRRDDAAIAEIEADAQRRMEELDARRADAAARRREAADAASAQAMGAAGEAARRREVKDLRERIGKATTLDELQKLQDEHDAKVGDMPARRATAAASPELKDAAGLRDAQMANALDRRAKLQQESEARGVGETDQGRYRQAIDQFVNELTSAQTTADIQRAVSAREQAFADITESRGAGAVSPAGMTAGQHADRAAAAAEGAADAAAALESASQEAAAANAREAATMRTSAAEARRGGDVLAAERLESAADALEKSSTAIDNAETQRQLDARGKQLLDEQERRAAAAGDAKAGQERAASFAKPIDTTGTFMSEALNRLGFGKSLSEQQAKDVKRAADAGEKLVRLVEQGAGVFA